jgi:hypothetical protein
MLSETFFLVSDVMTLAYNFAINPELNNADIMIHSLLTHLDTFYSVSDVHDNLVNLLESILLSFIFINFKLLTLYSDVDNIVLCTSKNIIICYLKLNYIENGFKSYVYLSILYNCLFFMQYIILNQMDWYGFINFITFGIFILVEFYIRMLIYHSNIYLNQRDESD